MDRDESKMPAMAAFESPFPESERLSFKQNPIVAVSAEIRFDIQFALKPHPVKFRSEMEELGFRRYVEAAVPISIPNARGQEVSVNRPQHQFHTLNSTAVVKLHEMALEFVLHDYVSYEQFRGYWTEILDRFLECFGSPPVNQVSLQYVDLISKLGYGFEADTPWSKLIRSDVLGFLGLGSPFSVRQNVIETSLELPNQCSALIRIAADQANNDAKLFIDAGFSKQEIIEFSGATQVLDDLKRHAGRFFRWVVADELRERMAPESIGDYCEQESTVLPN